MNEMVSQQIFGEFESIVARSQNPDGFREARSYMQKVFDPNTPTYELSLMSLVTDFFISGQEHISDQDKGAYQQLWKSIETVLMERGYRTGILTPQEHALHHSSGYGYSEHYKPVGIQQGKLTVEEARKARTLQRFTSIARDFLEVPGVPENVSRFAATLEELDDIGNTIRDPVILDDKFMHLSNYRKTESFPHKRGER